MLQGNKNKTYRGRGKRLSVSIADALNHERHNRATTTVTTTTDVYLRHNRSRGSSEVLFFKKKQLVSVLIPCWIFHREAKLRVSLQSFELPSIALPIFVILGPFILP